MSVQDLINIISSGVFATALTGALAFLGRNWISERLKASIQHEYDQKLETHKAQLKSQTEAEIIRLKAQLEIAAAERSFRFSHVFERTADTIAATHQKLLELQKAADDYTQQMPTPGQEKEQFLRLFQEKSEAFQEYFPPKRLYLPKDTASKVRDFYQALQKTDPTCRSAVEMLFARSKHVTTVESALKGASERYQQVRELLDLLEDDFQRVLGFPIEKKQKPI